MGNMTNKDVMDLFNNTELTIGLLVELEKIALDLLNEPLSTKNQMTMQGILVEVNKTLNKRIYVEKTTIEWEEKFQSILDKWYVKNQTFATEKTVFNKYKVPNEDLKK